MKEKIEKKIETFVYGILSLAFLAAFFFGVLYPSRGISPNAYKVTEPSGVCESNPARMRCPYAAYSYTREKDDEYDPEEIRYTFYIYERLKNS